MSISNLVHTTRFWNNTNRYTVCSIICIPFILLFDSANLKDVITWNMALEPYQIEHINTCWEDNILWKIF